MGSAVSTGQQNGRRNSTLRTIIYSKQLEHKVAVLDPVGGAVMVSACRASTLGFMSYIQCCSCLNPVQLHLVQPIIFVVSFVICFFFFFLKPAACPAL